MQLAFSVWMVGIQGRTKEQKMQLLTFGLQCLSAFCKQRKSLNHEIKLTYNYKRIREERFNKEAL